MVNTCCSKPIGSICSFLCCECFCHSVWIFVHVCGQVCVCECSYLKVWVRVSVCSSVCICVHVCVCVPVSICISVCICVYACLYVCVCVAFEGVCGGPLTHGKSVDPNWLPAKRLLQSRARAGTPAASQSSSLKQTTRSSAETLWALRPPH